MSVDSFRALWSQFQNTFSLPAISSSEKGGLPMEEIPAEVLVRRPRSEFSQGASKAGSIFRESQMPSRGQALGAARFFQSAREVASRQTEYQVPDLRQAAPDSGLQLVAFADGGSESPLGSLLKEHLHGAFNDHFIKRSDGGFARIKTQLLTVRAGSNEDGEALRAYAGGPSYLPPRNGKYSDLHLRLHLDSQGEIEKVDIKGESALLRSRTWSARELESVKTALQARRLPRPARPSGNIIDLHLELGSPELMPTIRQSSPRHQEGVRSS